IPLEDLKEASQLLADVHGTLLFQAMQWLRDSLDMRSFILAGVELAANPGTMHDPPSRYHPRPSS
ncbi:MAG: hypothetical protein WCK63_17190, partial [Betaproteobacteria bacterium]